MALRERSDSGVPVVLADPDDPAAQALPHAARGVIALTPVELPVMQVATPADGPHARRDVAPDGLSAVGVAHGDDTTRCRRGQRTEWLSLAATPLARAGHGRLLTLGGREELVRRWPLRESCPLGRQDDDHHLSRRQNSVPPTLWISRDGGRSWSVGS